jgi:hypothetical protein
MSAWLLLMPSLQMLHPSVLVSATVCHALQVQTWRVCRQLPVRLHRTLGSTYSTGTCTGIPQYVMNQLALTETQLPGMTPSL